MKRILGWLRANRVMLVNSGSLVGTTIVTSVLGFAYWWVAAHEFTPQEVGIGSASISTMILLGTICMMGLGTLLITELPRQPDQAGSLISTALIVVCVVGGGAGLVFALVAPSLSANLSPIRASISVAILFALGVSLTSVTLVFDQAMIGLLQGGIQLWRNLLFALSKLVILFLVSRWISQTTGMSIYNAWTMGNAISLGALAGFIALKKRWSGKRYLPRWTLLRKLGGAALQHHLLNLVLLAPNLLLPIMVTAMLSAQANAWFYVAWMIANFAFVVPGALTTVLHAINSAQQATLRHKARVTLSLSFAVSTAAICVVFFGAKPILSLFGSSYAIEATSALQIMAFGAFPLTIKSHYIAICRIHDRITQALVGMLPGGLLELGGAGLGAHSAGLVGLSLGWMGGLILESIFMLPTVYKAVFSKQPDEEHYTDVEPIWLIETALLPAIGHGYTGDPVWFINTMRLSAQKPAQKQANRAVKKVRLEPLQATSCQSLKDHKFATDGWREHEIARKI